MKKDTKGALRIKNIIIAPMILGTVIASTQFVELFKQNNYIKEETAEVQVAQVVNQDDYQRDMESTSRGVAQRLQEEEKQEVVEETKYISIDEIKISKDMDLSVRCGISKEDFKTLMKNLKPDTTKFFYDNADIIYDLCEKYEINEIFFCGLIAGESGWKIASNHRNTCNYISMMSKGKLIKYATPEAGLEAAAKLLHNCYLTEGGSYYHGKTLYGVQKCYCPESTWIGLIYGCMKQIVQ